MHPLSYVFGDIFRDHWGIPRTDRDAARRERLGWRRRSASRAGGILTDLSLDRFKE
jgi:hypothetical protein